MVHHEKSGHRGAFVWMQEGKRLAEMTYTVAGSRVIIDYTTVDDALRVQGIGAKLVRGAADWARSDNVKLMPLCPYAKSVFDKTPDYSDVLAK